MRKTITFLSAVLLTISCTFAQTPRTVIVEHFTNTDCSICASKNPAFFSTLRKFPDVLHIAYHPELPHPTCLLSHENRPENDARTQFYGIYGATPRAVIQGVVIAPKTPTIDSLDIDTMLHKYSPIALSMTMTKINRDSIAVNIKVITTALHTFRKTYLLTDVTEDTIAYTGSNGEPLHFDVFHMQLFSGRGIEISPATTIGDSIELHAGFRISLVDSIWDSNRINLISIVQDSSSNFIYQAAKQTRIDTVAIVDTTTTAITTINSNSLYFYPNPTADEITFSNDESKDIMLYTTSGQMVKEAHIKRNLSLAEIPAGLYYLHIRSQSGDQIIRQLSVIH